jgi:hypothetical protein
MKTPKEPSIVCYAPLGALVAKPASRNVYQVK